MDGKPSLRERIGEDHPEALFADGYDHAIIGVLDSFDHRDSSRVVYDADKIIETLMQDMSYEEAIEFFDFNIIGAWVGENTPVFVWKV